MIALRIAAIYGFLAVALGAFGAHGLEKMVDASLLPNWHTAALYHLVHSVVLLAIALHIAPRPEQAGDALVRNASAPRIPLAFWFFTAGITIFSGSLYVLTLTGVKRLGMITPIGGLCLLLGWLLLAFRRR